MTEQKNSGTRHVNETKESAELQRNNPDDKRINSLRSKMPTGLSALY
jgi:hypothetical protein